MATLKGAVSSSLESSIEQSKILLVGAGGIGCEVLKNLVLSGFLTIHVIDLDTIDVSNLNRQFLFQRCHVGKPKSVVARESALKYNQDSTIIADHDSIMAPKYDVHFFRKFNVIINALDNLAARSHVNRMCLAADVPLIESGSAGYLGQATVIKKGVTECYECVPRQGLKTYPGCTIRNTPSEPIHCIVWAKHLFNQLYGEADPDEDVSPDTADPEAVGDAGKAALEATDSGSGDATENNGKQRVSTREWAKSVGYDPKKLFHKLFNDDIRYLLSMDRLWEKRRRPVPLDMEKVPDQVPGSSTEIFEMESQQVRSVAENILVFTKCCKQLAEQAESDTLSWDKDEDSHMKFVSSAANLRSYAFGIDQKSEFEVKSMAGNIIPAIATTNAIVAGVVVLQALKVLDGKLKECNTVYITRQPNTRRQVLVQDRLAPPNPKCYVCSSKPEATLVTDVTQMTVRTLEEQVLKAKLNMVAPDVEIADGKGTILVSSEEGETEENSDKVLADFGIRDSSRLKCDDFLQNFEVVLNIAHHEGRLEDAVEFKLVGDLSELKPKETENEAKEQQGDGESPEMMVEDEDDLEIIEVDEQEEVKEVAEVTKDRKRKNGAQEEVPVKKAKISNDDEVITL